jgi:hypothetical protein
MDWLHSEKQKLDMDPTLWYAKRSDSSNENVLSTRTTIASRWNFSRVAVPTADDISFPVLPLFITIAHDLANHDVGHPSNCSPTKVTVLNHGKFEW